MADVISEYRKWKQQGETLRKEAKEAMEVRFRELLIEAVAIAEEYRAEFGVLKPPPSVTAFRYKAGRVRPKKAGKPAPAKSNEPPRAEAKPQKKPDPRVARLQQRLATARKKLEDAKSAGVQTRPFEDRVYEIEDALRLAQQPTAP